MTSEDTLILGLLGLYAFKTWVLDPAAAAGAWVGQNVITPAYYGAQYPGTCARGMLEGFGCPSVPDTPAGFLPSNWTWALSDGTMLGLPAGMTPGQFCAGSPASPICAAL